MEPYLAILNIILKIQEKVFIILWFFIFQETYSNQQFFAHSWGSVAFSQTVSRHSGDLESSRELRRSSNCPILQIRKLNPREITKPEASYMQQNRDLSGLFWHFCFWCSLHGWLLLFADFVFMNFPTHSNLFLTPKSNTCSVFQSFADMLRAVKNLSCQICTFPVGVEEEDALPCLRSSTEQTKGWSLISNSGKLLNTSELCFLFIK